MSPAKLDALLDRYRTMARIRAFEEQVGRHFREGHIHGFVHTSIGQEAVAAGVCAALRRERQADDHAPRARPLPRQGRRSRRDDGRAVRPRDGHLPRPRRLDAPRGRRARHPRANGIVGAGHPDRRRRRPRRADGSATDAVAVAFFGEGAVHGGAFHEALVLAVAWRAPVVFVCENNGYAEFTTARIWGGPEPRGARQGLRPAELGRSTATMWSRVEQRPARRSTPRGGGEGPDVHRGADLPRLGPLRGRRHSRIATRPSSNVSARPIRCCVRQRPDWPPPAVRTTRSPPSTPRIDEMDAVVAYALEQPYPEPATVMEHILD